MNNFLKGILTGAAGMLILMTVVLAFRFFGERDRKLYEAMEAQYAIETLREDMGNRPLDEFLADPAIRGAADRAAETFREKRDQALQRNRNGAVD
jgi:hypothetical protein